MFKILGQKFCIEKDWEEVSKFDKIVGHIVLLVGMGFVIYVAFHNLFLLP